MHTFLLDEIEELTRSTPEQEGISSASILHFFERIEHEDLEVDTLHIVRNGKLVIDIIGKPYHKDSFHRIYSAAKGIVATAILFAIQENRLSLHDPVIPLLPEKWIPEDLDERWNRLTVYHLLTMTTGHSKDTMFEMWKREEWIPTFFEVKPDYEPGTYFVYDMGAQYVMNEIIANLTGQTVGEYLEERLFRKIGVEYTNEFTKPEGLFFSSTMQLKPEGLVRLALFFLNKGKWNGEQLLREDLAVMAGEHHGPSSHYSKLPNTAKYPGYALHMWRNKIGGFRFDGGQGQFGLVLPEEHMAVSMLCCANNADQVLDIFNETIFAECFNHPIKPDPYDVERLNILKRNYHLGPKKTVSVSPLSEIINGQVYQFEENPFGNRSISFSFSDNTVTITTETIKERKSFICGLKGFWPEKEQGYLLSPKKPEEIQDIDHNFGYDEQITAYSGGWKDEKTFTFFMRAPSLLTDHRYECEFFGLYLEIRMSNNVVNSRMQYMDRRTAPDIILRAKITTK